MPKSISYNVLFANEDNDPTKGSFPMPMAIDAFEKFTHFLALHEVEYQESKATQDASQLWWRPTYRELIREDGVPRSVYVYSMKALGEFIRRNQKMDELLGI
jgi:hypothetical protein